MATTTDDQAIDGLGRLELLLTVLVIQAAVLGVVSLSPNSTVPFDMTVYADLASRIFDGALPYRDVPLEYPPLSLVSILSPRLLEVVSPIGGYAGYQASFLLLMGALSLALTALIWLLARRSLTALDPLRPLLYALLLVALASPLLLWRFDLLPAILTLLALFWTITGRPVLGGAALALAIAAKLYPAVLVPIFIAAYLATRDRRALGGFLAGVVGVGLVLLLGTLLIAPESVANVLGYSLDRGVQLESTFAGM
ncbi:MAG TPA: glycosyltransferase 87 family protein, partial [Candidatus Saccharimonadia bacterium]|nr:glycosyltransferase 87 family protein [Candidatus Saccharimonadia bacterium]